MSTNLKDDIYNDLVKQMKVSTTVGPTFNHHFVKGAFLEIFGGASRYVVTFKNGNKVLYEDIITSGHFAQYFHQYFIPYTVTVMDVETGQKVFEEKMNLKGKKVVIELCSSAIGDTLAWVPYLDQFQKKHDCSLVAVTFHNKLFKDAYPNIKFMPPGSTHLNVHAWYEVGWFYQADTGEAINRFKHPLEFKNQPLQKTAADILGLEYAENKPLIAFEAKDRPIHAKYVTIANHSTLQAKYWNYERGWQKLVDHFMDKGLSVVLLSKEEDGWHDNVNPGGVMYPENYEIDTIMNYIHHSEMFVGLGSGLTWMAWALGKPTVLISGFSEPYTEMSGVIRVSPKEGICSGCFNTTRLQNDGSWNWCPVHYGTIRQFECTKTISPEDVISKINLEFPEL